MTIVRACITLGLVLALAAPGFGQTLDAAVQAQAQAQTQSSLPPPTAGQTMPGPSRKGLLYGGSALFVAGMATAMYGFIRVGNGEFSTFGEATSRNKPLGAAGLAAAFGGGTMMFLGTRARRYAPSAVAVNREGVSLEKTLTW